LTANQNPLGFKKLAHLMWQHNCEAHLL